MNLTTRTQIIKKNINLINYETPIAFSGTSVHYPGLKSITLF